MYDFTKILLKECKMRKIKSALALSAACISLLFLAAGCFSSPTAVNLPYITIVNNTGRIVWYVNVSSTASSSWGDDLLASAEVLGNGESKVIVLPYSLSVINTYDMRLRDGDGNTWTKRNVRVTDGGRFVFTSADLTASANTQSSGNSTGNPSITIVNNTGRTIWYVNISSTASSSWGDDFLASNEVLTNGSSKIITLPHPINVVNRYDMRLVDQDNIQFVKANVQVSDGMRVVFTAGDRK